MTLLQPRQDMDERSDIIQWSWQGHTLDIGTSVEGEGRKLLLLPALSSISTRFEMAPLQERLAKNHATLSVDWPGFGDQPRPAVDWTPAALSDFLSTLLMDYQPDVIIAAGHAASFVLRHAAHNPLPAKGLIFIAPTWRGPLPTMMNGSRPWMAGLAKLVDRPGIGPLLYRLNVNDVVIRHMAAGHVYSDKAWLSGKRFEQKQAVVGAEGARHASVRFVAGRLDPFTSRYDFVEAARSVSLPMLVILGEETPRRSRAEIEALGGLSTVEIVRLPQGKLAVHEEWPDKIARPIETFLRRHP